MSFPSPARDYLDEPIDLNKLLVSHPSATFYMKVETDALEGDHVPKGSLLVIDRSLKAKHNDVIVGVVGGEMVLRKLSKTKEGTYLMASNSKFSPVQVDNIDFEVWGVVRFVLYSPNQQLYACAS